MEVNFDKEMDALLRQTARQQTTVAPVAEAHLDADTLSAFSANALPVKARERAMLHLVDCGNCRTILSNLVFFENEEEEEKTAYAIAASVPAIKEASLAERILSIFKFPALAYGMAGLAVIFAGAIGVMIYQSQMADTQLAQLSKTETTKAAAPAQSVSNDEGLVANYTQQMNANSSANMPALASAANEAVGGAFAVPSSVGSGYAGPATDSDAPPAKPAQGQPGDSSELKLSAPVTTGVAPELRAAPPPAPAGEITKSEMRELPRTQNTTVDQVTTQQQQRQDNYRNNNKIMTPDGGLNDRGRRSTYDMTPSSRDQRDEERKEKDDASGGAKAAGKALGKDKASNEEPKKAAAKKKDKKKKNTAAAAAEAQPAPTPTPTPAKKPDEDKQDEKNPCFR